MKNKTDTHPNTGAATDGNGKDKPTQETKKKETATSNGDNGDRASSGNFCHYFSNFGKCNFEEKNGRKCKFDHVKAPLCYFDKNCNRNKCMFSHSKKNQARRPPQASNQANKDDSSFLDQSRRPQNPINLWDMMTAFMQAASQTPTQSRNQLRQNGKTRGRF